MRYRKLPKEVDAVVWNGYEGIYEIIEEWASPQPVDRQANDTLAIHTLEGTMTAQFGDYVVRGVAGEIYPVKPDIFKATYEAVDEEEE